MNDLNQRLRERARAEGISTLDFLLKQIDKIVAGSGVPRTIFAACPNSMAVLRASLESAKRCNAPIKFAATLNQVDTDGGYTGFTHGQFVRTIREEARVINFGGPVIVAIDHGGPWLKDRHRIEGWSYEASMGAVKKSFEAALDAGFDLIHVDPTVDVTMPPGEHIRIEVVVARTIELIRHCEEYRTSRHLDRIAYEVGTEEVHGGLADMAVFDRFLDLLKKGLGEAGLENTWPCFVVGKVGTDLHTTLFDPEVARQLTASARKYGSRIKGHYSDNVDNPEQYPLSGMGAANVGPEFTEREYDGLMELALLEDRWQEEGKLGKPSQIKERLWEAVITSGRWTKWLQEGEPKDDFHAISEDRQEWLIKTGCRYIWANPEVVAARTLLYSNMVLRGVKAEAVVGSCIGRSMDRYFHTFNLVGLNKHLEEELTAYE
jgi:D-tagatose-1,6-bisphosphate aldolase subunit GatZ/KbaZ